MRTVEITLKITATPTHDDPFCYELAEALQQFANSYAFVNGKYDVFSEPTQYRNVTFHMTECKDERQT